MPFLELISTYDSSYEALEAVQQQEMELVFLDINMPDLTGLQFIRSLSKPPTIIFTTAYQQSGAIVDIWHCDAQGSYSEYGGSGMQSTNYQSVYFLRGRQVTGANGLVSFTTIFPGWYSGRATHIHVHIYDASGRSLKVTQIAFPEGSGSAVAAVNGYSKGMSGYTYNSRDNIFNNDTSGVQIASVTGNTTDGFALSIQLNVAA